MFFRYVPLYLLLLVVTQMPLALEGAPRASKTPIGEIAVVGNANMKRPADEATVRLGVVNEAESASEALQNNSEKIQAVVQALTEAGLKTSDYQTGHFFLRPLYTQRPHNADEEWIAKVRGYAVDSQIIIRTQDMDKLGSWIDVAINKGANTVGDISFDIHDSRTYRQEAIRQATAYAKADATALAASAEVRLGKILSMSLDQASHQPIIQPMALARAAFNTGNGGNSPLIAGGDIDVNASVTLVFEILQ